MGLATTANANGPYSKCQEACAEQSRSDECRHAPAKQQGIMTDIYLCRHGRTPLNAAGVLRGRLNPELDAIGLAEAHGLARNLKEVPFSRLVSSPLLRAVRTAAELSEATGLVAETDDRLTDRDYGRFNGALESELIGEYGSIDAAPGVESLETVTERALSVVAEAAEDSGPVALVTHCVVIRMILDALVPLSTGKAHVNPRTGSWSLIRFADGCWHPIRLDSKDMA